MIIVLPSRITVLSKVLQKLTTTPTIFCVTLSVRSYSSFSWMDGTGCESRQGKAIFFFYKTVQIGSAATPASNLMDIGVRSRT
jgi:hypothetical protein